MHGIAERLESAGFDAKIVGLGPLFQIWFTQEPIRDYRDAVHHARRDQFRVWWEEMMQRGVLFHPDAFENLFVSFAHTDSDVECTLQAVEAALPAVRRRLR